MYTKFTFQSEKVNYFLYSAELSYCKYTIGDFFHFRNFMEAISLKAGYLLCCHPGGPCLEEL